MLRWLLRRICIHNSGIAVLLWWKIVLRGFIFGGIFVVVLGVFFAVSSKNGHLHTEQWSGLRVLWAAVSRVGFVPCYQQHKLIYYRDLPRSILPLWEKTPDLAAVKPPHLTFGFKQNQLCSKTCYSLKGFSTSRFSISFSDTLSQFECLVAQHFKQFCHGMHPVQKAFTSN